MTTVEKKQYLVKEAGYYAGLYVEKGKRVALSDDEAKFLVMSGTIDIYVKRDGQEPAAVVAEAEPEPVEEPIVQANEQTERTAVGVAESASDRPLRRRGRAPR